jgi:hypothetical protein
MMNMTNNRALHAVLIWGVILGTAGFGISGLINDLIKKVSPPDAPTPMPVITIPTDVNKISEAILAVYAGEMVPSGDKAPVIGDINPREGQPGTVVTVTGHGFGATQGLNAVSLNLIEAQPLVEVLEWNDTKIRFLVPIHCTSGDVNVVLWGYLHDHSVQTLDDLLNPARLVPGSPSYRKPVTPGPAHPFMIDDEPMRRALVEFLNSI